MTSRGVAKLPRGNVAQAVKNKLAEKQRAKLLTDIGVEVDGGENAVTLNFNLLE